jgi:serine/threonine protein kinase
MEKKYNIIPERIKNIQEMFQGDYIDSILDFQNHEVPLYSKDSDDIRELLPKKYIDFAKAINDLGGKLLYIKSGSTGHTFKGVHPDNDSKESYAVKIVAYPKKEKYGGMYNSKRPENTELLMIKLLSYFVINKQSPHIVLPITTFNTSIKPFLNLTKSNIVNNKKFDNFIERYDNGEYYQNVSILVSEWANGGDLLDYLKKHYKELKTKHWKVIFFQILSVLAIIQTKYPSFRHNDMKANNILIHNNANLNEAKYLYKINDQTYIIPNIGFQIKLWDFDFACIPGVVNNSKVDAEWTNKINIKPKQHKYYDIHYFFSTLTRKGFFPEFYTEDEIPTKVKEFVKRVIPPEYETGKNVSERGRILVNDEYTTPDKLLKTDIFFKCLRK